ncbi:MAG: cell division protein ZapA [Polyangiaceae bacterium]|nr:cell division protein ZapA [Polyangiaceae bacterium]
MPPKRAMELRVGGQTYRVVGSENDPHVQLLADLVDRKYNEVVPAGKGVVTVQQGMFAAAMALAEELVTLRTQSERLAAERDRAYALLHKSRETVARVLTRVEGALSGAVPVTSGETSGEGDASDNYPGDDGDDSDDDNDNDDNSDLPSDLDALTLPPDVVNEPILMDLSPPSARAASNRVRDNAPAPAQTAARAAPNPVRGNAPIPPRAPATAAQASTAGRPGLRLVRRAGSDDDEKG